MNFYFFVNEGQKVHYRQEIADYAGLDTTPLQYCVSLNIVTFVST